MKYGDIITNTVNPAPYKFILVILAWVASVIISGLTGLHYGAVNEQAKQAKIEKIIEDTRKAANLGAADAISKLKLRHTTIKGRVETIVRDNPVYRDCQHDPVGLQNINDVLSGTGTISDSSLPQAVSPKR